MLIVAPTTGSGGAVSGQPIHPAMTSDTEPAPFLALASHADGNSYRAYKAFNQNYSDTGWAGRPQGGELWVAYKHNTPVVVNQTRVTVWTSGRWQCNSYELYGTNDDFTDIASANAASWTLLDTVSSLPSLSPGVPSPLYPFTNSTAYQGYKFRITSWGEYGAQVQQFDLIAA